MELESIKARLEAIIDQMPVGILVADARSGEILFANDEIEKMYGLGFRPTDIKGFVDYTRLARQSFGRSFLQNGRVSFLSVAQRRGDQERTGRDTKT